MGDYLWLIGPAMLLLPASLIWWERRHRGDSERSGCQECGHDAGVDGESCADHDDNRACTCQNDYHWRYESVTR